MKSDMSEAELVPLDRLDANKLLTFLAIAEAGGVTAASRRLALTRSAVSHSLRALEDSLGLPLFHRVGKRLIPTREGRVLRGAVAAARERLGAGLEEVLGTGAELRGTVRVGLFLGFSRFRLASVVDAFLQSHPRARVRVAFGPQAWLVEQLRDAKLDLVLSLRPTRAPASPVRSEKLFVQSLVLAAREPVRSPARFEAVARLPIVDYYQSDPLIDRWSSHHFGRRRVPRERIRAWVASTDLALELVLRGAGAAVLPEDVAVPYRRRGELALLRGPREPLRDAVWLNELGGGRGGGAPARFRELLLASLRGPR
jgi:DNA-binding transcriptional LysR family regulator